MDKTRLNLKELMPLGDREFNYPLHESMFKSLPRSNVNIFGSTSIQQLVGQPSALSQDAFSAFILSQCRLKGTV